MDEPEGDQIDNRFSDSSLRNLQRGGNVALGNVHVLGSAAPGVPAEKGVDGDTISPDPSPVHVDDLVVYVKPPRLFLVSDDERERGRRRRRDGALSARIFSCILQLV